MASSQQGEIIYALVARGQNVLAEYTERQGNFEQVTRRLLNKIDVSKNTSMSYVYPKEAYAFHYLVDDGIIYLCMADESFGRRVPFQFLYDMKQRFKSSFEGQAKTAVAYAFNADFQGVIRRLIEKANNPKSEYRNTDSKITEINEEIANTKNTVMESIDKVLDRGDRIDLLVEKSDKLTEEAVHFNKHAKKLKHRMFWKNLRMSLLLFFIVAVLLYIILGLICGFDFKKC